jgi:hypothetical protein
MTPLYSGQLRGACAVCAAALIMYVTRAYLHHKNDPENGVPATCTTTDTLMVELDGDVRHRGIYFLPAGSTVADLLLRADNVDMEKVAPRDRETHVN